MDKKTKSYLSFILAISLMFTSLFTGVVFADTEAASLNEYIARFEANPVTTGSSITYSLNSSGVSFEGNSGEAAGLWVDATKGKINGTRGDQWAQVNDGTVFYVPVNGEADIEFIAYNATSQFLVQDISEDKDNPDYWENTFNFKEKTGTFTYGGKSQTVIKITVSGGVGYLTSFKVMSKGVQEGPVKPTWEKRDFSLKINGTLVTVTGAAKGSEDASVTLDDNTASVVSTGAKEASLKIALPKTGVTADMLTDKSSGISADVVDGKVVVTFNDAEIEPKTFTIGVTNKFSGKEFSLSINDITVKGNFTEEGKAPTFTLGEGAGVLTSTATSATISMALDGAAITADSVKNPSANIDAAVEGGAVKITFKDTDENGNLDKPWDYEIKVSDNSVSKFPPAGYSKTYTFAVDMTSAEYGNENNKVRLDSYVSADEYMTIKSNTENEEGKFYRHDDTHGLAILNGNTFEINVAGNAAVMFAGCEYGADCDIKAAVKDGEKGTITPASGNICGSEGKTASFVYEGEATTLVFTVSTTGEAYLHNIVVSNEKAASAGNGKIDVWDFGAATLNTEEYNNYFTVDFLNGLYDSSIKVGSSSTSNTFPTAFEAGDLSYSGKANSNRLRTTNANLTRYDDGSSVSSIKGFSTSGITGCLYLNGSSGAGQGVFTLNLLKDDVVYLYIKMDNADDYVVFEKPGSVHEELFASLDGNIIKFIAPEAGSYRIYDTDAAGKMRLYRITREHAVYANVSGSIDTSAAEDIPADYKLVARNEETMIETAITPADGSYDIDLATGYTYTFRLDGAIGYRISEGTKVDNLSADAQNNITIVPVIYHTYSGIITGMDEDIIGNIRLLYEPSDKDAKLSYGTEEITVELNVAKDPDILYGDVDGNGIITAADASIALKAALDSNYKISDDALKSANVDGDLAVTANDAVRILSKVLDSSEEFPIEGNSPVVPGSSVSVTYTVDVAENVPYELVLEGANDYMVISDKNIVVGEENVTKNIEFEPKPTNEAKGNFVTSDGGDIDVTGVLLTRLSDDYTYSPELTDDGYSIKLCDGVYKVSVVTPTGTAYEQATHVIVDGKPVEKDIYFLSTKAKTVDYAADIYVDDDYDGSEGAYHYATLKEAVEAVNAMPSADNNKRVTIHIAPGTYRAQHILTRPNVSLINSDPTGVVNVTWYYGIGYKYYSAGSDGYYNELNAVDKYLKNDKDTEKTADVQRWGGTFYIKNTATDFYAENILFENSFNKYITDEEIEDGVEPDGAQSITYDRTAKNADARCRAATERAAAILVEGDRSEFYKCSFSSSQDTLYTNPLIHSYYKDCFVEGMTDYIFGDGEVVFEDCTLNFCGYTDSTAGGHLTATKYDQGGNGYLFYNCKITATSEGSIKPSSTSDFGRPWGSNATVTFVNAVVYGNLITARGYADMSSAKPENANYKEYNTTKSDGTKIINTASKQLTAEEAAALDVSDWFGDWTPINYN